MVILCVFVEIKENNIVDATCTALIKTITTSCNETIEEYYFAYIIYLHHFSSLDLLKENVENPVLAKKTQHKCTHAKKMKQ